MVFKKTSVSDCSWLVYRNAVDSFYVDHVSCDLVKCTCSGKIPSVFFQGPYCPYILNLPFQFICFLLFSSLTVLTRLPEQC